MFNGANQSTLKKPQPQPPKQQQQKPQPQKKPEQCMSRRSLFDPVPVVERFTPNFDAIETEDAYALYGELPGAERENVSIEFSDPQTIVIHGTVERNYSQPITTSPPASEPEEAVPALTNEEEHDAATETPRPRSPYQATVEDDTEDEDAVMIETPKSASSSRPSNPKTPEAPASPSAGAVVQKSAAPAPLPAAAAPVQLLRKERAVGKFRREFSFPKHVNHDGVTAHLENGILSVIVPKVKMTTTRVMIR
ncbi:putative heat shock protein [Apodospora peruviana]|uniref:Heat shock protein n=1 Tax=Apodospora peruviana TaxID=516989 RepID=A0AAE0IRK3_9PEZI|nr:putative heat shock protein [Apodospora peruviana]